MVKRRSAELAGRCAIVTGASQGIGRAVAELFAGAGASLVLVARRAGPLAAVARCLDHAIVVAGDVADRTTADAAAGAAMERFGRLDVVANIAGVFPTARLVDIDDAAYRATIDSNLTGTLAMCRAAVPLMRDRGGSIVNMSSMAARHPAPGLAAYAAAKAGVEALTRAVAIEAAPTIRVNAVSAGPTLTETVAALVESDTTGAVAAVTGSLPLGRMASPKEIAEVVLFLASDRAAIVTGQVLHANAGGLMA